MIYRVLREDAAFPVWLGDLWPLPGAVVVDGHERIERGGDRGQVDVIPVHSGRRVEAGGGFSGERPNAAWGIRSAMPDYILRNWSGVRTGPQAAQRRDAGCAIFVPWHE